MTTMDDLVLKIITIGLLVESIVLHEVAHGYVAGLFGDPTARRMGRISFNPIPHIDPVWTIVIPIVAFLLSGGSFIIGGAKPVPVNPRNYRRPVLGDICVSAAGVAVNFLIAIVMILLINIVYFASGTPAGVMVITVMLQVALLNIVLALFNLIPIPPLDGSHLLKYLLPQGLRAGYVQLGRTGAGFIILILVINMPGLWNVFSKVLFKLKDFLLGNLIFF
jgi:Zn-dependent protease